jgi:hypothetical protein
MRYELVPLILDHSHSSLLWDHLNWADPFTILHGVDDAHVE